MELLANVVKIFALQMRSRATSFRRPASADIFEEGRTFQKTGRVKICCVPLVSNELSMALQVDKVLKQSFRPRAFGKSQVGSSPPPHPSSSSHEQGGGGCRLPKSNNTNQHFKAGFVEI